MTSVQAGKKQTALQMRVQRCNAANEFIQAIASCGRHFFRDRGAGHNGFLSLNPRGTIVWFHDVYTGQRINISKEETGLDSRMEERSRDCCSPSAGMCWLAPAFAMATSSR